MVTQAELDQCVWEEAQRYLNASYAELAELARRPADESPQWRWCGGEDVCLAVLLGEGGTFRKRITVELIMSAGDEGHSVVSIVYFERFRSGKIHGPWPKPKKDAS